MTDERPLPYGMTFSELAYFYSIRRTCLFSEHRVGTRSSYGILLKWVEKLIGMIGGGMYLKT